jgi:CRISPR-associated protein Csx14
MVESTIPVDLRNPGQVFACLGLMEAAEALGFAEVEGGFNYAGDETQTSFTVAAQGHAEPVAAIIDFLASATTVARAPAHSKLSADKWNVVTETEKPPTYPGPIPDSPATLAVSLRADGLELFLEHWLDGDATGRDNIKLWAGSGGYPGAALARDALDNVAKLGDNARGAAAADPFAVSARMSSSFRFDWRRDYIPLDAGFSPNIHGNMTMIGYPLVEILAALGLQNARPSRVERRDKLAYRYGVSSQRLPLVLARAMLGGEGLGFPIRLFRMRLGWPGQEGQARCIIDASEEAA